MFPYPPPAGGHFNPYAYSGAPPPGMYPYPHPAYPMHPQQPWQPSPLQQLPHDASPHQPSATPPLHPHPGLHPHSQDSPASVKLELPTPNEQSHNGSASPSTSPGNPPPAATPSTTTKKAPFVPPPPPPPLSDPLALLTRSREGLSQLVAQGNVDARPSRQGPPPAPKSGACAGCRTAKAKCSQDEPACTRCVHQSMECVYPVFNKRGRKRMLTPNQVLLANIHADIEAALAVLSEARQSGHTLPPAPNRSHPTVHQLRDESRAGSSGASEASEEDDESRRLKSIIESPLAVLAHISSLKVSESTDEEGGKTFVKRKGKPVPAPESYFTNGLYQMRSDAAPEFDPVNLGIISEAQFERAVQIYFTHFRPFFYHLDPNLHTPQFLRDVSPFLSSVLAQMCCMYDPELSHLVNRLDDHVCLLSNRIWAQGLKSLEIVQGYLMLIHWTTFEKDWGDDRRWAQLGQALRIATEIKLFKPLSRTTFDFYRSVTPLGDDAFDAVAETQAWTWKLVFVTDIALCVSTGRTGSIQALAAGTTGTPVPKTLSPEDPNYNLAAVIHLNRIYAKAHIHSNALQADKKGHDAELRSKFKAEWQTELHQWFRDWPQINAITRLIAQHNTTILLSISLRFKGPVAPVLEECRLSARETAKMAIGWRDSSIGWANNLIVINIAYAATLLLRIAAAKGGADAETRLLCAAVADLLIRIGAMRPTVRTLATLHGTRIRALLSVDVPKHLIATRATYNANPGSVSSSATAFENTCLVSPSAANLISPSSQSSPLPPSHPHSQTPNLIHNHLPPHPPPPQHGHAQPQQHQQQQAHVSPGHMALPSLFDLPPADSHHLWDLFNEAGAAADQHHQLVGTGGGGTGMETEGGQGGGGGEGAVAYGAPDTWVWKTSNNQDWLNSEPGAWAW